MENTTTQVSGRPGVVVLPGNAEFEINGLNFSEYNRRNIIVFDLNTEDGKQFLAAEFPIDRFNRIRAAAKQSTDRIARIDLRNESSKKLDENGKPFLKKSQRDGIQKASERSFRPIAGAILTASIILGGCVLAGFFGTKLDLLSMKSACQISLIGLGVGVVAGGIFHKIDAKRKEKEIANDEFIRQQDSFKKSLLKESILIFQQIKNLQPSPPPIDRSTKSVVSHYRQEESHNNHQMTTNESVHEIESNTNPNNESPSRRPTKPAPPIPSPTNNDNGAGVGI